MSAEFPSSRLWLLKCVPEQLANKDCASLSLNPSKNVSTLSITAIWIRFSISSDSESLGKLDDPDTRTDSSRSTHFSNMAIFSGTANDEPPGVTTLLRWIWASGVLNGVLPGVLKGVFPGVLSCVGGTLNGVLKKDGWTLVLIALALEANCNAADVVAILWKSAFTQQMRTVRLLPESESCLFAQKLNQANK